MHPIHTIVAACVVLGATQASFAQLNITSANREVYAHQNWQALAEYSASETESFGPDTTFGQWDAEARVNPVDPDYPFISPHVYSDQHSFLGSSEITADLDVDIYTWEFRPSLGYMSLEALNVLDFTFTITEPIPVDISMVHTAYKVASVSFDYSFYRVGGGFGFSGSSWFYPSDTGQSFQGVLEPGDYVFTSKATFEANDITWVINPTAWNATFNLTAVPAPGAAGLALCVGAGLLRRRRD